MKDELFSIKSNILAEVATLDFSVKLELMKVAVNYHETLDTKFLNQALFMCKLYSIDVPPTIINLQSEAFKIADIKDRLPKVKANALLKKNERVVAYNHVHLLVKHCGLLQREAIERSCARPHERHKKVHNSLGTKIFQNLSTFESDYFKWERKNRSTLSSNLNLNIRKLPNWTGQEISDFLDLFPNNVDFELC